MDQKALIAEYISQMKKIDESILQFLENDNKNDIDFENLRQILEDFNIKEDKCKLKEFCHLMSHISNNHHHTHNFFNKIEQIITLYLEDIKKKFSESEIFKIFCKNKWILLYLFENKILTPNKKMLNIIVNNDRYRKSYYLQYFYNEFSSFIKQKKSKSQEMLEENEFNYGLQTISITEVLANESKKNPELFIKNRKIGENNDFICQLIRNDSIDEFIKYVNVPLDSKIKTSIFETNTFLLKEKEHEFIEYAAFYGSIQIFKYLLINEVELKQSLWAYAIHGQNYELIHLLEEKNVIINDHTYEKVLKESIKCHYHDLTKYIMTNYGKQFKFSLTAKIIRSYNFFFLEDLIDVLKDNLFDLCKYDYIQLFKIFIKDEHIDINMKKTISCNHAIFQPESLLSKNELENFNLNWNYYLYDNYYNDDIEVKNNGDYSEHEANLLFLAVEKENIEIIQILLTRPDIDVNCLLGVNNIKKTVLHAAIELENLDIIRILLSQSNININIKHTDTEFQKKEEKTALIIAVQMNNLDICEVLLKQPNIDVNSKLMINFIYDDSNDDSYDELDDDSISNQPYKSIEEIPVLVLAVQEKNQKIIQMLISRSDIDINSKYIFIFFDKDKNNDFSIETSHVEKTALHEAIDQKDIEIVKLLLSRKDIDVNIKSIKYESNEDNDYNDSNSKRCNFTPLCNAIYNNCPEIVELLLSNNQINVNLLSTLSITYYEDEDTSVVSFTALHLAVNLNNIEIIKILMKHKEININAENGIGQKPIDLTDDKEIKELLMNHNSQ